MQCMLLFSSFLDSIIRISVLFWTNPVDLFLNFLMFSHMRLCFCFYTLRILLPCVYMESQFIQMCQVWPCDHCRIPGVSLCVWRTVPHLHHRCLHIKSRSLIVNIQLSTYWLAIGLLVLLLRELNNNNKKKRNKLANRKPLLVWFSLVGD